MPTSNFQPIRLLDPDYCYEFTYLMVNSADPDQLASEEANWSGSTLFAKSGYIRVQQDKGITILNGLLYYNIHAGPFSYDETHFAKLGQIKTQQATIITLSPWFDLYHSMGIFSRWQIGDIFLIFFPRKQDLTFQVFDISCNGDNLHDISKPVF